MKKHIATISFFAILICFAENADAQRRDRGREREREETPRDEGFKSRLWYGGGFNIGLGAFNGFSSFNIGISPMVGYRIAGPISVGPRIAVDFTSLKQRGVRSVGLTSVDVGAFLRCRVFQGLFLQGEVSNEWFQDLDGFTGEKFNDERVNQRIGAGWNFGQPGGFGTEIGVLYNFRVANDLDTWRNPIEYRFGFTWRF